MEENSDRKVYLVATDDGYAQVKLVGQNPNGVGLVKMLVRSSVRPGRYGMSTLSGARAMGSYSTEEGEDYTVSDDVEGESTMFDGFHVSPLNRVLVNHALVAGGYGGHQVGLVAGLPVGDFFIDGALDQDKIVAKTRNLSKAITSASGAPMADIVQVKIGCQAIAAFVDYLLDDDLVARDVATKRVAVVDIGGRTTDIAVIMNRDSLDASKSGTSNIGVLDVYEMVARGIRAKFKTRDKYTLSDMDRAVRSGSFPMWGEPHDVSDLVAEAVREQETKIEREVSRRIGAASNVDVVLFVGGGAALFTRVSEPFRNGKVAPDPEFANARGLLKYMMNFSK